MGVQHGQYARRWRSFLLRAMEGRVRPPAEHPQVETWFREVVDLLAESARPFMEYARGQAAALDLDTTRLLGFCLTSYLEDRLRVPGQRAPDGCTAWAAGTEWTQDGQSIVAKNRDQSLGSLPLQAVVEACPLNGRPYVAVTTLGWPGVASSGINVAGLAIADTHVLSTDLGPGFPRWWLMMAILEQLSSVPEALDYLRTAPRLGNGNLVLADAAGRVALFEEGHSHFGLRGPTGGFVVATNHFTTAELRDSCLVEATGQPGDTLARRRRMEAALAAARGMVSPSRARLWMARSGEAGAPSWQNDAETVGTISTAILAPGARTLWVRHGRLSRGRFRRFVCSEASL
jgi:hypothetical protein